MSKLTDEGNQQADWLDILETPESRKKIEKVAVVLRETFPDQSPAHARLWGQALLAAQNSAPNMYHFGVKDKKAIQRFQSHIENAVDALQDLSPWASLAFAGVMVQSSGGPEDFDLRDALGRFAYNAKEVARRAEASLDEGQVRGSTTWAAVAVTGEARRCWDDLSGEKAPSNLNPEAPFGDFLARLFEALQLGADARSAINAWRRQADT